MKFMRPPLVTIFYADTDEGGRGPLDPLLRVQHYSVHQTKYFPVQLSIHTATNAIRKVTNYVIKQFHYVFYLE